MWFDTMMPITIQLRFAICIFLWAVVACGVSHAQRPNIILMMADDLGFSDLGCYGGEIETPNLDQLAENGLRYTQFYNTGRCWPTRASLLTGYYPHQIRRDKLPGVKPSGGGGQRPEWAPLLPKLLKSNGYRSYHTGKWHLDSMPIKAGFDRSYYLGDQARFFSPKTIFVDDVKQPEIPRGTDYYATTALADQAVEILKEHAAEHPEELFFHYIAWTAPHFPLHALPGDIAKYEEMYMEGWDHFRDERWKSIQERGIVDDELSEVELNTGAPYKRPDDIEAYGPGELALPAPWDSLTDEQRRFQATKMAIHAAMIDRMDIEIGKIIQQLKDMGVYENTVIMFLSDNGASAELMIRDDGHDPAAAPGSADSHLCLGPGWSTTCNTPFRKHKTWVHEGGIATPLIVHWPRAELDKGQLRHHPAHVIDIVPTIMDLAGDIHVAQEGGPKPPGKSLIESLVTDNGVEHEMIWWSHENHNAIRIGNWKAVKTAQSEWELFNLKSDRAETNDSVRFRTGTTAGVSRKLEANAA